jgi:hypothetical protein
MRNLNKFVALGLLLILYMGLYMVIKHGEPEGNIDSDENDSIVRAQMDRELEEFFYGGAREPERIDYKVVTFPSGDGWGYKVMEGKKVIIEQFHIPAINGTIAFATEEQAKLTGLLVTQKIMQGNFPPTITIEELDSLGVVFD